MYNPYLVVPFLVWAITQFLKFILAALNGRLDFRYLYASGGMPSVHSAVVTSLAVTAFLIDGPESSIFGVTALLAAIVMYDSFGVRRASGEQAAAINLILESLNQDRIKLAHPQARLREILGHKPLEVTIGALLGFALACLFNANRLSSLWNFAATRISTEQLIALTAISGILVVGAVLARILFSNKYRGISVVETLVRRASGIAGLYGLAGLALAFLAYERVAVALWIVWPLVLAAAALVTIAWFYRSYRVRVADAVAENREAVAKGRWFEGPNKKRRAAKERARKRR